MVFEVQTNRLKLWWKGAFDDNGNGDMVRFEIFY